jgi:energy-converting hydrogenase Eha subunit C
LLIMLIVSIVLVIIGATGYFLNRRSLRKMRSDVVEP